MRDCDSAAFCRLGAIQHACMSAFDGVLSFFLSVMQASSAHAEFAVGCAWALAGEGVVDELLEFQHQRASEKVGEG